MGTVTTRCREVWQVDEVDGSPGSMEKCAGDADADVSRESGDECDSLQYRHQHLAMKWYEIWDG